MIQQEKEIYFHVGLGKTASKFLQHKIFPRLQGIYYIKPSQFKRYRQLIDRSPHPKMLLSREFDNQLEAETAKFALHYPHARIIIILRRHDAWIASQYRRHLKNGYCCSFDEFIDTDGDTGRWRRDKLFFMPKLLHLEKLFGTKPLVLFHDELQALPRQFIGKIIRFTATSCDMERLRLKPYHTSYSDKQLRVMRHAGKYLLPQRETPYSKNPLFSWMQKRARLLACYSILYPATLVPGFFLPNEPLIPAASLEKIRRYYAADWEQCRRYAADKTI
ncbi:MAG TPA: hypothetical protein VNJ07_08970 [Chitinophagales bacterium]|nr:hypothetical protein [Chitinophagales bacterium]